MDHRKREGLAHPPSDEADFRFTTADAAAVFQDLCGAPHVVACATLLADAIDRALSIGGAWAVTLNRESIFLNVGQVRLLAISPGYVWFATSVDAGALPQGMVERSSERGPVLYKSVPVPTRDFSAAVSMVGDMPPAMRSAFLSYVEEAARRRRGISPFVRAHSPGVIAFLNERLGRSLPDPDGAPRTPPVESESESESEDISSEGDFIEGRRRTFVLDRHERSAAARAACIRERGAKCCVCRISFGDVYGELGEGFIEVHHLEPLSDATTERPVDPVRDLVPVCPNCHRMLHRAQPPLTPAELAARLRR